MIIDHWKGTRDFALFDDDQSLIAVFVYRKGAERVKAMIQDYRGLFGGIQDNTGKEGDHESRGTEAQNG